ncbi:hypothetical protein [Rhodococcus sp. 24CO]|uniref:hypothetical protein n=1 Tax=Rhodococcus sp. 24CO TaxID=3117460 RepID=UPI003D358381
MTLIADDPIIVAKFTRAAKHGIELRENISKWVKEDTELIIDQSDDLRIGRLRLAVSSPPRVADWSVILGDTIHNLRSALDIWMYKYIVSTCPDELEVEHKNIYFPVCDTGKAFTSWKNRTGSYLSGDMITALLEVQPYKLDAPLAQSAMWLIHQFDIADKHREPLVMDLASQDGLSPFTFTTEHPEFTEDSIRIRASSVSISEGGLMVIIESDYPLYKLTLSGGLNLIPYFKFEDNSYQMVHTLTQFMPGVQQLLRRVEELGTSTGLG